jgi:hypothetical protein
LNSLVQGMHLWLGTQASAAPRIGWRMVFVLPRTRRLKPGAWQERCLRGAEKVLDGAQGRARCRGGALKRRVDIGARGKNLGKFCHDVALRFFRGSVPDLWHHRRREDGRRGRELRGGLLAPHRRPTS